MIDFAQTIKSCRCRAGLSQKALSRKAGLHEAYIWKIEHGEHENPSLYTVQALAKAMNMKAWEFIKMLEGDGLDADR